MKPKHTPGPWVAKSVDGRTIEVVIKDAVRVALCGSKHDPENQANATLIAASPEMLAALKHMVEQFGYQTDAHDVRMCDPIVSARAAIAKAEGRS